MPRCKACGKEISKEEYEQYNNLCSECWDDRMTEEGHDLFEDFL